jgi:hypothetical protein
MGWRGTAVLALGLAVAALYLYRDLVAAGPELTWETVLEGPSAAPPGERVTHLLSFDPAAVTAIHVRRGAREWHAERRAEGWTGAGRPEDLEAFLAALLDLAEIMPIEVRTEELADHGLDPPEAVVELERGGQPPVVLLIGRHNPPATGVYAQLGAGGRVVLTGALALWELDKATRALSPTVAGP